MRSEKNAPKIKKGQNMSLKVTFYSTAITSLDKNRLLKEAATGYDK